MRSEDSGSTLLIFGVMWKPTEQDKLGILFSVFSAVVNIFGLSACSINYTTLIRDMVECLNVCSTRLCLRNYLHFARFNRALARAGKNRFQLIVFWNAIKSFSNYANQLTVAIAFLNHRDTWTQNWCDFNITKHCVHRICVILTNLSHAREQYPNANDEGRFDSRKVNCCDRIAFNFMSLAMCTNLMFASFHVRRLVVLYRRQCWVFIVLVGWRVSLRRQIKVRWNE